MNFWHIVRVLRARWRMIAAIVAMTLLVVILAAPKPKVVYQSEVVMRPTPQVMAGGMTTAADKGTASTAPDRSVILSNLIVLAKSGGVMQRALDFLALDTSEQQLRSPGWRDYKQLPRIEVDSKPLDYDAWQDVLEVSPVFVGSVGKEGTTTDQIRLTITMTDGDKAPYLANAVAYAFSEFYKEKSKEDTRKYSTFLESIQKNTREKLQDLQLRIAAFKSHSNVVAVDAETSTALSTIATLSGQRDSAQADAREAQAALYDIDRQLAMQPVVRKDVLPGDMNPTVIKLKEQLAQAQTNFLAITQKYKPTHPSYKAAQDYIAYLKNQIAKESTNYAPPVMNDIRQALLKQRSDAQYKLATARARLASLNASQAQAQGKIGAIAKAEPELANLMRDYQQLDNRYKMTSEQLAQTQIAERETNTTGSIAPIGWAPSPALGPIVQGPRKKALLVYGFVLSLLLGVAVSIWLDSIDNKMRNASDVEKLLELPVLGLTPKLPGKDNLPKLTHMQPLSAMAESYKILRTNVLFAMRDNPFKTLMVATGRPGQGATTTVCNLAIALAQIGKRIILIDADMRRPSLHKFFGVPNDAGLSTLLQGTGNVTDAFQTTEINNLILVPAGPQPMNPSELIGSQRMREVIDKLEEQCDLVMFDTPSTIVFSDGPMMASWIDAVIMIVSANQAPRGTETVTRDLLRRAKANILGVVVNRMSPENVDSCYYYSHYYSDSAAKPMSPELGSGNGKNGKNAVGSTSEPKAIPAAVSESGSDKEDSPFPD